MCYEYAAVLMARLIAQAAVFSDSHSCERVLFLTAGESRSTKRSYNTQVLRSRLDELEAALNEERTIRLKVNT